MNIKDYIQYLLSVETYSFSLEEIRQKTNRKGSSLKFILSRLIKKKEIVSLRKGFYLIIPPRYSRQGHLPIQLFINKLFKSLNREYYVSFYSAAKFHGASHQQIHKEYVVTKRPKLRNIKKSGLGISFFTSSNWPIKNILEKKSDAGLFKISSPALTVVDLIQHQTNLGGMNRMLPVVEELSEEITHKDIKDLLSWYPHKSTLQRFGFLLNELQLDKSISQEIKKHLEKSKIFPVLLSPKSGQKPGKVDKVWKVDVNINLENDL